MPWGVDEERSCSPNSRGNDSDETIAPKIIKDLRVEKFQEDALHNHSSRLVARLVQNIIHIAPHLPALSTPLSLPIQGNAGGKQEEYNNKSSRKEYENTQAKQVFHRG